MKTSYLFLADGFEEIEALATVDILRRAAIPVKTVSINATPSVTGAKGVTVQADMLLSQAALDNAEWLIAPGGMPGASNLAACPAVTEALTAHHAKGGRVAAICASPALVLAPLGLLDGIKATCYPGMATTHEQIEWTDAAAESTPQIVTGSGPANTLPFALAIVAATKGEAVAREEGAGLLYKPCLS